MFHKGIYENFFRTSAADDSCSIAHTTTAAAQPVGRPRPRSRLFNIFKKSITQSAIPSGLFLEPQPAMRGSVGANVNSRTLKAFAVA